MEFILVSLLVFLSGLHYLLLGVLAYLSWRWPPLYGVFAGSAYLFSGVTMWMSTPGMGLCGAVFVLGAVGSFAGSWAFHRRRPYGRTLLVSSGPIPILTALLVVGVAHDGKTSLSAKELTDVIPEVAFALITSWAFPSWFTSPARKANAWMNEDGTDAGPDPITDTSATPEWFRVVRVDDERHAIVFIDAPKNCHALEPAPREREASLDSGRWLVLCASIWNGPDREAVSRLLEIAKHLGPETCVGVRPFKHPRELATWCPDFAKETRSPIWILYDQGQPIDFFVGSLSEAELIRKLPSGFTARSS